MINRRSAALILVSCFIIYTFYYNFHNNNLYRIDFIHFNLENFEKKAIYRYNEAEDFLINTPGCYIPNYGKTLVIKEPKKYQVTCGERAVFIKKTENYKIEFRIRHKIFEKYRKNWNKVQCYYNFAQRSTKPGKAETTLSYTAWTPFEDGENATLLREIVTVKCNASHPEIKYQTIYNDAYVFVKKLEVEKSKESDEKTWNVLLVGMDTMSRARAVSSMPRTVQYFHNNGWLDYKGYQKVGFNTFPNVMAVLTGKKMDSVYNKCTKGMSKCNDLFVWSRYRTDGYITAYGEDSLSLPDTFSRYKGFQTPPTHHYLRPFFKTGEKTAGNLNCAKHKPSAIHLLDYASQFANTYINDKFFGVFWINSYSHNLNHIPTLLDDDIVAFFKRLNESEVLNNTIVIFTSDHGTRYGQMRVPVESYYDERLPMLFVWIPHEFRETYEDKYHSLQINQNRLVTPYDLYLTLEEIRNNFETNNVESEACPQCSSFFEEKSPYRTCADAGVSKKWCSCHDLTKVYANDTAVKISLHLAVSYIQNVSDSVKTLKCKVCQQLHMKRVLRSHRYIDTSDNKTHYVVAWQMTPGAMSFEATVMKEGDRFTIVQPTHTISEYNKLGNCVQNQNDRQFCVCKQLKKNCSRSHR